jgi:hypothetical protein
LVKPDGGVYGALTTPDPVTLHKTLAELSAEGITHLAFEASSHGLDQHRLDGVRLKAAAFHQSRPRPSRLSPEHGGLSGGQAAPLHRVAASRTELRSSMPTRKRQMRSSSGP